MSRPYNFGAGPAALPEAVLRRARDELLDYQGRGMSVMEMSHRGAEFAAIAAAAEADLRALLAIPENYKVLFLQGGATSQFAMVPLNLLRGRSGADYLDSGIWSRKAIAEADRFCTVNVVASAEANGYTAIPSRDSWQCSADAAYLHYTHNETINGLEFAEPPAADVPLVADMSSTLLSRPIPVERFGLIYAGAQKNIGPAGLTIVIVRQDLIGEAVSAIPSMFDYQVHGKSGSMSNTPPTYAWYIAGLVFKWLLEQGGLAEMEKHNRAKAQLLYRAIDDSADYANPVAADCRSWMNVPFSLRGDERNDEFLSAAKDAGLLGLKGHRSVGGMRASIYNATPLAGVQALVDFMADFSARGA